MINLLKLMNIESDEACITIPDTTTLEWILNILMISQSFNELGDTLKKICENENSENNESRYNR